MTRLSGTIAVVAEVGPRRIGGGNRGRLEERLHTQTDEESISRRAKGLPVAAGTGVVGATHRASAAVGETCAECRP